MYKTFILLAVLLPSVLFAQDIDWWDKSKNEFSLSTSAELEGFAALINEGYDDFSGKTINLSGDITLSGNWTPIKAFNGIFNGNGHSISGLSVIGRDNAGLFGSLSGQIKNLTIEASIIFSGGSVGQGHAGVLAGSFGKIDIENVIVTADTVGSLEGSSGGLIGYGEGNITIINSNFTGNIWSGSLRCSGGLVGSGNATISNSYSKGNIMGSGLVGCGDDVTISNSYSTGEITGGSGLVNSAGKITISNSYFTGEITGGSGLVGSSDGDRGSIVISDSYFIGEITANGTVGGLVGYGGLGGFGSGGLLGRNDNYRGSITISNSYSTSNITANSSNGNNGTNVTVGGLVGYGSYGSITISNSYSTGDIRANVSNGNNVNSVNVGGLVGYGNAEISNSYSTSNVTANVSNRNNVGGLIGSSNSLSIINSYASGTAQNGIAGNVPSSATKTFIGVYYNSEGASSAVNGTIAPGVKALSPEDLKKKASFAGWDFVNIWDIEEDESYPYLLPFPSGSSSSSYDADNSSSSGETPIRLPQIATANQVTQIRNGLNLQINDNAVLEIYGLKGNLIGRQNFKSGVYNVSLGYLPKGMYIVKATFGSKKQVLRIPVM